MDLTKLEQAAKALNVASDQLAEPIMVIEKALQRLNLGIQVWHQYNADPNAKGSDIYGIGYICYEGTWALVLRRQSSGVHETTPDVWKFNQAPRYLRVKSVSYLPELIDTMVKAAEEMQKRVVSATGLASEFARSLQVGE